MIENEAYYHDLMILYLDGEASDTEQKVLFDAMAENPELQDEFTAAIDFNKAMIEDREALVPSEELTHSLFVKAGFETAAVGAAAGTSTSIFSSIMQNIFAGLVVSSIAFSGYTAVEKFEEKSFPMTSNIAAEKVLQEPVQNTINPEVPTINAEYSEPATTSHTQFAKKNNNSFLFDNVTEVAESPDVADASESNEDKLPEIVYEEVKTDKPIDTQAFMQNPRIAMTNVILRKFVLPRRQIEETIPLIPQLNSDEKLNISLSLSGISGLGYLPGRRIENENGIAENFSIGVRYHFNEHHALGLATSREALQMYEINETPGEITFDRKSNILMVGVNYKYNVGKLFNAVPVNPFAEVMLGGSKYGPVGKISLGLNYDVSSSMSFGFGVDFTSLMYSEFNRNKFTYKYGLIYGFMYKF